MAKNKLIIAAAVVGLALFLVLALAFLPNSSGGGKAGSAKQLQPGQEAFNAATNQILVYKSEAQKVGFGNTPEAEELAAEFARLIQVMQKLSFTGGKQGGASLSSGNFLTYCERRGDSACFLVHVPQLRNYKDKDVRLALAKIAWATARTVTEKARKERRWELGLGLRGSLMYGVVATGATDGEPAIEQGSAVPPDKLYRFFAPAAAAATGGAPTPGAVPGAGSPAKIPGDAPAGNEPTAKDAPPATPDKP